MKILQCVLLFISIWTFIYSQQKNETILQGFEWETRRSPSLWSSYGEKAREYSDAGFTMIWIPPPYKCGSGIWSVGYDPYDYYDLGEFNQRGTVRTKYGTIEELISGINELKKNNIKVIIDAVINHKSSGDKDETFIYPDGEVKVKTIFDLSMRNNMYSSYIWDSKSFDGYQTGGRDNERGVLLPGKEWDKSYAPDYLSGFDIDYQNGDVREEMIKWGVWITEKLGTDGFRIDAIKHIDTGFISHWADEVRIRTGKELFMVGEAWFDNKNMLIKYMNETSGKFKLFDFSLYTEFNNFKYRKDVNRIVTSGLLDSSNGANSVTFVNNHDTLRPSEKRAGVTEGALFFYAYILANEFGTPCVFLQDYKRFRDELIPLLAARRDYAYGKGELRFSDKESCCYVRNGTDGTNGLILLFNKKSTRSVKVKFRPGTVMRDITGNIKKSVRISSSGVGNFKVIKNFVSVWVPVNG